MENGNQNQTEAGNRKKKSSKNMILFHSCIDFCILFKSE